MKKFLLVLLCLLAFGTVAQQDPPPDDAPYRDSSLPIEDRIDDLLARMTLEEKIGQMTLIEKNSLSPEEVTTYMLGGVLSGGGGYPVPNTPEAWAEMVREFQEAALETRLGIPLLYGVDAVHGHNNVRGAVIFPHNVGLGATRNADLVRQIAEVTARDMLATGIHWDYAPVLAVPQDIRWGRAYEGYGENTALVTELGLAFLQGMQGEDLADPRTALATPKHYVGDGGAAWGTSPFGPQNIDRGVTAGDEDVLRAVHLAPYLPVIEAGAMSVMASFSSWDDLNMHAQTYLLTDVLKGELGFEGFIVSDWEATSLISDNYAEAVTIAINAGVDMNMVPYDDERFITTLTRAVEAGDVPMTRIDDAVRRILRAKFMLGLFEQPFGDAALLAEVGSEADRELAREAVSQSLVLLKNADAALPIADDDTVIFVAGEAADDIGIQSGGWTIEWQGQAGNITEGTTLLDAIEATVAEGAQVNYNRFGRFDRVNDSAGNPVIADVAIAVISEPPYAEWMGDDADLALAEADAAMIERLRERSEHLVVVLLSGRPLIITEQLAIADAFVAAWLPGTEGQGVVDVLFGDKPFTGRLPYTWPRSIDQLPFDFANLPIEGCSAPLFPYDYGLTFEESDSAWLELAETCG
ncbi:MAG: glycoside hydrolase family 3 N-terminal domain-containing protein [Anaerolineae bacterium]